MAEAAAGAGAPWPLAGHAAAVAHVRQSLAAGHIAHAYLITGPDGAGRATLARLFASALVCQAGDGEGPPLAPCGVCRGCAKVARGVHPDVEGLSLESQGAASEARGTKNRNITIESIRGLRERLALRPLEARWRVAIIEDAETMSGGGGLPAASALLKTLEEPPPYAVIILIAPDAEAVLPTLRSRCRHIPLGQVGREEIAAYLVERLGVADATAAELAALAQGRPGWAIAAAREPALLEARQTSLGRALALIEADEGERLRLADEWAARFGKAERRQAEADLDLATGLWRDVVLLRAGCPALATYADLAEPLRRIAERLELAEAHAALAAAYACSQQIRQSVNPRLALEAMALAWPALTGVGARG
jgi:DNA polymerase-3 subunit delta'